MDIVRNLEVPTGNIVIVAGDVDLPNGGLLEFVSLGDYGKDVNLKADFMGLDRDIERVVHTDMLPLTDKWVITVSTQYGCSMGCKFCDVPKVGKGINATFNDLIDQVMTGLGLHPEIEGTDRLNIHFARMGEPSWNPAVIDAAIWLHENYNATHNVHPVVSTMMPKDNLWLSAFIRSWMYVKNRVYSGNAGLQLSINSTNQVERDFMFSNNALTIPEIAKIMDGCEPPLGRKITLNFAVAGYEIDPAYLLQYFDPDYYLIKLTPMHKTDRALKGGIQTEGDYATMHPYQEYERSLKEAGYDVLVFIASEYEDMGRITCGNAILSGTLPEVPYREVS